MSKVPPQLRDHIKKKVQEKIEQKMSTILDESDCASKEDEDIVNEEEIEEAGFYRNPDKGSSYTYSGIGKKAMGITPEFEKMRGDSRLLKQLQGEFIGDISLLKYGKSGQSPRRISNVIRKYEKKAAKAGIEFEVPNFEDVLSEKVENELTDIKKGQDSINNLNEQRNQKLNDELMRRLLK